MELESKQTHFLGVLMNSASAELVARRGELLAELFFQDLGATRVLRSATPDVGVDFFVGFENARGGLNFVAVEVKATERPVPSRYPLPPGTKKLLSKSNLPGLLVVVDVKQNRIYCADLSDPGADAATSGVKVEEVTQEDRQELVKKLSA